MGNNLFTNSKVEGVISPLDAVQPEIITITGNTNQVILFEFKTNVNEPAKIQNTTRVDYCRAIPVTKPLTVTASDFLIYDESCPVNTNYVEKSIDDGITTTDVEGKTIALKVTLVPSDTINLPDECAFAFYVETTEFGKKLYAFGSLQIRHFPIPEP